jgi:hypothetical protein
VIGVPPAADASVDVPKITAAIAVVIDSCRRATVTQVRDCFMAFRSLGSCCNNSYAFQGTDAFGLAERLQPKPAKLSGVVDADQPISAAPRRQASVRGAVQSSQAEEHT